MMPGKHISPGDSFTSNLAGMSKNQLYEIMSQMKTLIEQNQQQARQILVDNPALTKALFQAQIMLGMVKPPQVMPSIQPALAQTPKQSTQPSQQLNTPAALSHQEQASASQTPIPARKQHPNQSAFPIPSTSVQTMPTHSLQSLQHAKGHPSGQMTSMSLPQSSQLHNMPTGPPYSAPQPPSLSSLQSQQVPIISSQPQQSMHTSGIPHLPLQPPLPPQPRPPSMQPYQHQGHSQMGSYQPAGASQSYLSQPSFNSGNKPPGSMGPSFPQGQPPLPSQPPPHSLYQGGGSLQLGTDFSGQAGSSMQVDRPAWMPPGLQENPTAGLQLPGPPMGGQMGIGNLPPRPAQLTPDMEKALLQQVMSLTPEQIHLLPPEQRNQVLQLQQMLR